MCGSPGLLITDCSQFDSDNANSVQYWDALPHPAPVKAGPREDFLSKGKVGEGVEAVL